CSPTFGAAIRPWLPEKPAPPGLPRCWRYAIIQRSPTPCAWTRHRGYCCSAAKATPIRRSTDRSLDATPGRCLPPERLSDWQSVLSRSAIVDQQLPNGAEASMDTRKRPIIKAERLIGRLAQLAAIGRSDEG